MNLPDELAEQARSAGLNVSGLTQDAIRSALHARRADDWLDEIGRRHPVGVGHGAVAAAVADAKDEHESGG